MLDEIYFNKIKDLDRVFSPSAPIKSKDLFSGRITEIRKLYEVLSQKGEHAVLYGERGVGKTSLANIISEIFNDDDLRVVKVTCSKTDDFKTAWKRALQKLKVEYNKPGIGFGATDGKIQSNLKEMLSNERKIVPGTIIDLLSQITVSVVIVFDEYDSIINNRIKSQFADLIKDISDNLENVTIVIVGIGTNVIELIGEHPSVERCLKQVQMPKMSDGELKEIIEKGLKKMDMKITEEAKDLIIKYSVGLPHYTHLLTKYSAKTALVNERLTITEKHFAHAMEEILENTNQSIKDSYHKAIITSKKESKFENVVSACAISKLNDQGCFKTIDVVESFNELTKSQSKRQAIIYNLGKLCQKERGELLMKVGKGHFKFKNPLIRAFIRLKLYNEGKLY